MHQIFCMVVLIIVSSAVFCIGDVYMVVEYDTNGTLTQQMSFDVTYHTVDLIVTVMGCDTGYYADTSPEQTLKCNECVCKVFPEGRDDAFVAEMY